MGNKQGRSDKPGELLGDYKLGKVLGQGNFGVVYSCKRKHGDGREEFAVKMIDKVESTLEDIKNEIAMLQKLDHPTIVKLHDVYYEKVFVCVVMDVYKGGDLIDGMQSHWESKGMIPCEKTARISRQMVASIEWLHSQEVCHRDVKGDNFLMDRKNIVDPDLKLYLSDFGTAVGLKHNARMKQPAGTRLYWPPEVYSMNYAHKMDIWAIGVVSYGLVRGNFPFKDETGVRNKVVKLPSSVPKHCQEFILKMLEKDESKRFDANQALQHKWLSDAAAAEPAPAAHADFQYDPQMGERRAGAGVDERRRVLVERLEKAAASHDGGSGGKNTGEITAPGWDEQFGQQSYEVVYNRARKSIRYEWWPPVRALQALDVRTARPLKDNEAGAEVSMEGITRSLKAHSISTDQFGKGKAKTLKEFTNEVRSGQARLLLDASRHKTMVRVVDIVILRLCHGHGSGKKFLVQTSELYADGRRKEFQQLAGMKKLPHENSVNLAARIMQDRLQMSDCDVTFDFDSKEFFEEEEDSPSYPGVRTVYRKTILPGELETDHSGTIKRLQINSGKEWKTADSEGVTRFYKWMSEAECLAADVSLYAPREAGDISALVQAPPLPLDEQLLARYLERNHVDVARFPVEDFSRELMDGEATLETQPDGSLLRVVDVVVLRIVRQNGGAVLVEASEKHKNEEKALDRLPAGKLKPHENQFLAARRILEQVLRIDEDYVNFSKDVKIIEEVKDSHKYPGLRSKYRKRVISGEAVDSISGPCLASSSESESVSVTLEGDDGRRFLGCLWKTGEYCR